MDYSDAVLGGYAARKLRERAELAVLTIGSDHFTRHDLAAVECFNFLAAFQLSHALADLGARSTRDVYERLAPVDVVLPRVGVVALAVLGAAFEAHGLGGNAPLESWYKRHLTKGETIVGFASLKSAAHARQPQASQRRRKKQR
jgi:hypothetical protein